MVVIKDIVICLVIYLEQCRRVIPLKDRKIFLKEARSFPSKSILMGCRRELIWSKTSTSRPSLRAYSPSSPS